MSENFNSNVNALFNKMEGFISTKTVVGEPVQVGDIILLPLIDVNFGMGVGAMDSDQKETDKNKKEIGGGGIGAKISPSAVVVINGGNIQLVNVKNQDSLNKLIDMVPGVLSKFNFGKKDKQSDANMDIENDLPEVGGTTAE